MSPSLEENLSSLVSTDQWQTIISMEASLSLEEKSRFLWAWPSHICLNTIQRVLNDHGVTSILSIGCGSGLLEWIINRATGIPVAGLELDRSWWSSSYAPKTFIDLHFTNQPITSDFLANCVVPSVAKSDYALLFCYFNNRTAFLEYIRMFTGQLVIIIGPVEGSGIVTDPTPMKPQFEDEQWEFHETIEMLTQPNIIAFYRRKPVCVNDMHSRDVV